MTFDIRSHIESLTPVKGQRNRYECPACGGQNLTVNPKMGAYQCWTGQCDPADIRLFLGEIPTPDQQPNHAERFFGQDPVSERLWAAAREHGPEEADFLAYLDELKRLDTIADPIRKNFELFRFSRGVGIPQRIVEKAIAHIRQKTKLKDKTVFELDEFLGLPLSATPWLVPGLVPSGETILLAGLPKEGKSLVGYDLAFAIATGKSTFFGERPVVKGRVLLVLSDESPRSIQGRLAKRGFTAEDSGMVRIMTRFSLQNLSELEAQLDDFQPCLTVIDSLKSISQGSEISENSAEFGDAIYGLKELLTKHDSAGILMHHTNKNSEAVGVSQVRGSTAIAGAVWGVWILKTPKLRQGEEQPKDRYLEVNPREGERKTLSIELDPSVNTWTLISSTQHTTPEQSSAKEQVLALLRGMDGKGLEFSELRDMLPDLHTKALSSALRRLVDDKIAGKRPSKTTCNGWVYYVDSRVDSHGFITDCELDSRVDSPPKILPPESTRESIENPHLPMDSAEWIHNSPPRGAARESIMDSGVDSHGFTSCPMAPHPVIDVDSEVLDCDDISKASLGRLSLESSWIPKIGDRVSCKPPKKLKALRGWTSLEIVSIGEGYAEVKNAHWSVSHKVPITDIRLIEEDK